MQFRATPRYFLTPLKPGPLWVIVTFGFCITISQFLGMFGVPIYCVLFPWFLKYGFVMLDEVIEGRDAPEALSAEMVNPVEQRPLVLFLLLGSFHMATAAAAPWIGEFAVTALRIALLCLVPAMVGAAAIEGRLIDLVDPRKVFGLIARMPWAYAVLLCTLIALWTVPVWLVRAAADELAALWIPQSFLPGFVLLQIGPSGAAVVLGGVLLFMYLWLAMFANIGGAIYEQRAELGYDAAEAPERRAARMRREVDRTRDRLMDGVFAEVRGGAFANAGRSVREIIEQDPEPLSACRWIYDRAAEAREQRLADYVAQLLLPRLAGAQAMSEAFDVLKDRMEKSPAFKLATGGQTLQFAQLAGDLGEPALARRLLQDFDARFPADPMSERAAKLALQLAR